MAFKIEMDLLGRCFITIVKDSAIFFLCIREPGSIAVGHPKKFDQSIYGYFFGADKDLLPHNY
jgi:hypothetical protein